MKFFNLPKKIWVPTLVVCAVILAFVIIFPIVYCVALKVDLKRSEERRVGKECRL